jgi:hypothetical protein
MEEFVRFYSQDKETTKLKDLYDRLVQVANGAESTIKSASHSFIDLSNASYFDFKAVRKYEMKEDIHKEGRIIKTNKGNNEIIYNIHTSQIAGLFWFNDRTDSLIKRLNVHIERYLEFQGNKRFMMSYSDPDMDKIHQERGYQYLLSASDTLSLDFCSRKLLIVKKNFTVLGTTQRFASLKGEFIVSVPRTTINRTPMSKLGVSPIEKGREDNFSIYAAQLNQKSEEDLDNPLNRGTPSNQKLPQLSKLVSRESNSSRTSEEVRPNQNQRFMARGDQLDDFDTKKKATEADEEVEKHFEFVFDILGHYFGIDDKISTGCNTGFVVKDWSYPVDCICLFGDRGIYVKSNFMIRYEKETKTLINLLGRPEARNYNLGKYYMDLEDMTKPYQQDELTKNKFRKQQGDSLDKMYFIRYKDICEIHSKHYMGKKVIGLEFWTIQRRPRLFIFNIHQISTIWPLIIESWIKDTNNSRENILEIKKQMTYPLYDKVSFWLKMVSDVGSQSKLVVQFFDEQTLTNKLKRKWEQGYLDNFNYLMMVNACAGRSLKFMSCYYIFPQIIANYGQYLDSQEASLRDLSKPLPVQKNTTTEEIEAMKEKYNSAKFNHGNFYSNKNILEHYLFRLLPYTQYQYDLNDGRLDERMFYDFDANFKVTTGGRSSFEMIPENYYMDSYLLNVNNLDFKNEKVDNVFLPDWANHNPRFFNLKMRQALESPYINKRLGKWIDLIFGVAQQGKKAEEALNAYMSECSVIVDPSKYTVSTTTSLVESNKISKQLNTIINMMFNLGQTPAVVFTEEHPVKHAMFDPEKSSVLSALHLKLYIQSPLNMVVNPLLEILTTMRTRMDSFNQLVICEDKYRTFGPIGYLLKNLKVIKNRYP